jgi:predicted dehydrogenase
MSAKSYDLHGARVLECAAEGPALCNSQDAVAVIGEALANGATLVVIPTGRLDPGFFQLRTGIAGEMLQKFVNYRLRLAIIGDLSELASRSTALRDFLYETNRGESVWFLAGIGELERRLALPAGGPA